jgi:ABC-type nickel/cobalt efflux system permease component RcnA
MLLGITLTLSALTAAVILARDGVVHFLERHGGSIAELSRALDALSGLLLVAIGAYELMILLSGRASPFVVSK